MVSVSLSVISYGDCYDFYNDLSCIYRLSIRLAGLLLLPRVNKGELNKLPTKLNKPLNPQVKLERIPRDFEDKIVQWNVS